MSAIAVAAIKRCYSIIGMDTSSLRFQWLRRIGESWRATYRRRRELLTKAGAHLSGQYREWDELSGSVRDAIGAAVSE